jgi:valacyclovir hydrolase
MPEIAANGTTIFYEDVGHGPPLLLLHGGLGTARLHWWKETPFFAERCRVIAPDLRGYGRSSPPRDFPLDFYERDAADMAALLRYTGLYPAHVLGWSDGAIVALVLAVTEPELVRTLVIVSGEARILPQEREGWRLLVDTSKWSESALRRFIEEQGPQNWPGIFDRLLAGYHAVLERRGGEIISSRLHEIRCPTLIVHGEDDPIVPVVHAYEMAQRIPGAWLSVFPGCGHFPHREREEDFRERVLAFLDFVGRFPPGAEREPPRSGLA